MSRPAVLSIRGEQHYPGQEPDVIELVTDGTLERTAEGWSLSYAESDLTGLEGVQTTFSLEPERVTLTRTGKLESQMVFQEGVRHESLYRMEFGVLMVTVCATQVSFALSEEGGSVDVSYSIELERNMAGTVHYHLEVRAKEDPEL